MTGRREMERHTIVRGALLMALMILLQSLRLLVPVPPFVSMFVIGSAVNACLLLAAMTAGLRAGFIIACLAPVIAYFQQALPLPVFILPVAVTNIVYILLYEAGRKHHLWLAVLLASVGRMAALYFSAAWIFSFISLPAGQAFFLKTAMSWPQLVTGLAGGVLCHWLYKRLPAAGKAR